MIGMRQRTTSKHRGSDMRDCEYVARALLDGIEVNFRLHCIDDGKGEYILVADIPDNNQHCMDVGGPVFNGAGIVIR